MQEQYPAFLRGKKVLLTTSHTDVGSGGSMQMYLLADHLVRAGAVVHVLFKQGKKGVARKLDLYHAIGISPELFRPNRWWSPVQILRMRRRLVREKYDIIHTHKGGDLSLVLLASLGLPVPVLVNQRGVNFRLGANRFKYNLKRLDRTIVVSEESRKVMVDCNVRPEKIEVIYGGVDLDRFRPDGDGNKIRAEFGLPADAPLFLVVANLVRQKGHGDYLEAAALLQKKHPGCFHLFAGSGDPTALREQAVALGIADQVIFAGFRKDVPDLFAAADVSVFPGFAGEGVSGVLRESLACGVPVITTDVGGNAELIRNEQYGLVVEKRNPEALAAAMTRLLEEPEMARELAEAGRAHVLENHSAEARNRRMFDLYKKIAMGKGYEW